MQVARRFVALTRPLADPPDGSPVDSPEGEGPYVAAALLHDVGKTRANLGTMQRVAVTLAAGIPLVRARIERAGGRAAMYLDHERIGADMLAVAGSHRHTVALVAGAGETDPTLAAMAALLRAADDL
jgi:hypothetical protein